MFIFAIDQELWSRELIECIISCDHSLCQKDILKSVYCFTIIFFTVYIFKHFLLFVPFSHQESAIMFLSLFWFFYAWIGINMWIYINIRYFEITQHRTKLSTSHIPNNVTMHNAKVRFWIAGSPHFIRRLATGILFPLFLNCYHC
jgi:hypothetical protein